MEYNYNGIKKLLSSFSRNLFLQFPCKMQRYKTVLQNITDILSMNYVIPVSMSLINCIYTLFHRQNILEILHCYQAIKKNNQLNKLQKINFLLF